MDETANPQGPQSRLTLDNVSTYLRGNYKYMKGPSSHYFEDDRGRDFDPASPLAVKPSSPKKEEGGSASKGSAFQGYNFGEAGEKKSEPKAKSSFGNYKFGMKPKHVSTEIDSLLEKPSQE